MLTYIHCVKSWIQKTDIREMQVNLLEYTCLLLILRCKSEIKGSVLYIYVKADLNKPCFYS